MGLKLDAPVATNALDSSGEILSIQGLDITDFIEGRATANWEHSNTSEDGAVGRFIYAKKIFSEQDCETPRQLNFWKQLKHEFLYGIVELFDDEGHPGAVSIAAMARYFIKRKEKIRIGMSIEGSTLDRDGHLLNRAVARKAAITLTPCNKECWIEYAGEEMPISKSESVEVADFEFESFDNLMNEIASLDIELEKSKPLYHKDENGKITIRRPSNVEESSKQVTESTKHLKQAVEDHEKKAHPNTGLRLQHALSQHKRVEGYAKYLINAHKLDKGQWKDKISGGLADNESPKDFDHEALSEGIKVEGEHTDDIHLAMEIAMDHLSEDPEYYKKLKTIEKNYNIAPSQLTGQAALTKEHIAGRTVHNTLKAVLRDWDKKKPLKEMVKAALPQLTDNYVDHFTQVAEEMALKKGEVLLPQDIIPFSPIISEQQQDLLNGLSLDNTSISINAAGQKVILREVQDGHLQSAYSFLMGKYFGLGEFFPISNNFTHKDKSFTAELVVENSIIQPNHIFHATMGQLKISGSLFKIYLADLILGKFSPRTNMSMLFAGPDNIPVCTYTNDILTYNQDKLKAPIDLANDLIPVEVVQWLESKQDHQLKLQMSLLGLSRNQINQAVSVKSIICMNRHQNISQIIELIKGGQSTEVKEAFSPELLGV